MEPLKIPLAEIPCITRESPSVVRDAIDAGHLETFVVGRRRFARPEAIRAWVDFLEEQSRAGKPVAYRARVRASGTPTTQEHASGLGCVTEASPKASSGDLSHPRREEQLHTAALYDQATITPVAREGADRQVKRRHR